MYASPEELHVSERRIAAVTHSRRVVLTAERYACMNADCSTNWADKLLSAASDTDAHLRAGK